MKALLKQKVNDIFKLKRTYLLLLFVITMFSLSVLLEKYWRNYLKGYTVIFAIIIMVPVSYIYSLFLTEESKNTLIVFLKINKRKYKLYIFLILMLSLITTALLI